MTYQGGGYYDPPPLDASMAFYPLALQGLIGRLIEKYPVTLRPFVNFVKIRMFVLLLALHCTGIVSSTLHQKQKS